MLKKSFHLINFVLMSLCYVFLEEEEEEDGGESKKVHEIDLLDFNKNFPQLCVYDLDVDGNAHVQVIEYEPGIFKAIRDLNNIEPATFFKSFAPSLNYQGIFNFFTGTGKSSSLFFFTDNKTYVVKTLKEDEKSLLLDSTLIRNYYLHMKENPNSMLSKFFGVYTIRPPMMNELHVIIMDNIVG